MEYLYVSKLNGVEYMAYLHAGWRRFGHMLFRQSCSGPGACRSLRVDAARFRADRSHRRTHKVNEGIVRCSIGAPSVTREKIAVFERFQSDRSTMRGWSPYAPGDAAEFVRSLASNPFPTQEWCYYLGEVLIGVGYVDELPGGLSAIYFARDPAHGDRSLGTWNVLCLVNRARALGLPHIYLGYHAAGCPSLQYKARFRPHERLDPDGLWRERTPFLR
jgi:arginine-tRNA-protein transferase